MNDVIEKFASTCIINKCISMHGNECMHYAN